MKLRHTLGATLSLALAALPLCTLALAPIPVHAQQSAHGNAPVQATTTPRTARYCTNCATVEAVKVVEVGGGDKASGTSGGAAATVAGTGAAGGRNIGPGAHRTQRYEVIVRYASNGTAQTLQYDNDPGFRAGDAVRVNNGVLSRDQ